MKLNISKKMKIIIPILLVAIVASVFAYNKFYKKKVEPKAEIKNVKVVKVALASLATEVEYSGKLKGVQEISVSSKMVGKVSTLGVKVGDVVEKGQVLFTLDAADAHAQVQQSQAGLDSSNANLAKTRDSAMKQQVIQADQSFRSAEVNYNDSKNNYEKMQQLYQSGSISKQELDTAQLKFNNAAIALNASRDNLNITRDKLVPQSIEVAAADVQRSQAAVNSAMVQLDNATIAAPMSGTISVVNIHEGEFTSAAVPSITIIDAKTLIAEVSVPDKMLTKIQVGQVIPIRVNASTDKDISGTIDIISPAADSKTQSYVVKIKIDNPKGELKPGMFSKALMPADKKENVIAVPNEAIKSENGTPYVYTVVDNKVKKIAVNLGLSNSKITEITSDQVKIGDNIITEGQIFLNDGEKVNMGQ